MATDNSTPKFYLVRLTEDQIISLQGHTNFYSDNYCVGNECRRECSELYDHLEAELQRVVTEGKAAHS